MEGGEVVFRFEPLIVAVECRDVGAAQEIVSTAIASGFRESGITSIHKRIMVAIRCSIRMEVPLGRVGLLVVSPEYVRYLVGIANEKMEANRKRTDGFLHDLQNKVLPGSVEQRTSSNKKNQGWMTDEGSLLDLKAKQNEVLSKLKKLEIGTSGYLNHDYIVNHVKDNCGSESAGYFGGKDDDAYCNESLKDINLLHELEVGYCKEELTSENCDSGLSGTYKCCLSVVTLLIVGEPVEKLFLWGQSVCALSNRRQKQIIVFGGFGGIGRHARRNYSLMLDLQSGLLKEIDARGPPTPRLGHTSSVVGDRVFVIGGRGGPTQILNDVWVLNMTENIWMSLECAGSMFHPRHRHAAAVAGSNIYVFGGLNGDAIYSCMNVLNTESLQWSEVIIQGEWPCARHSHCLVANDTLLFMFGGYDGEKALGDLYSFDTKTCLWKKEKTSGRPPFPRFSHSMFIYKGYLGIIGGCPIRQHNQELALLNLHHNIWMHVTINSVGRDLWVRSSASVIDDELVIVGGGTSCYAFGTKFNQPVKINLQSLDSVYHITSDRENKPVVEYAIAVRNRISQCNNTLEATAHCSNPNTGMDMPVNGDEHHMESKHFILQVEKKYAKLAKDILKKFGWLDLSRKVRQCPNGNHILLPVNRNFYPLYQKEALSLVSTCDDSYQIRTFSEKGISLTEVSIPMALNLLTSCSSSLQIDDVACDISVSKAPRKIMKELVCSLLKKKGMQTELLEQLPLRWGRLGDIVVLPLNSFKDPMWDSIGEELWPIVAKSLGAQRLARQGRILPTLTRDSTLEILVGDNGWVTHQENGILYTFDVTKCMFSSGNHSEKLRMANLDSRDEVIVDLFAGIGYFVLPFLVKAGAKLVYACEWNPHAIKALQHNIHANSVAGRCIILEGDNRVMAPKGVADRVCLGLLPSSESSWLTAVRALRVEGGMLHVHGNVNDSEENSWVDYVVKSIGSIAQSEGLCWDISIQHLERVKWYGPHIRHLVADIKCKQVQNEQLTSKLLVKH